MLFLFYLLTYFEILQIMQYKSIDNYIEVNEQKLETPERTGFVAVEWGGTEIK